jgi:ferredoxin
MMKVEIDRDSCNDCLLCVEVCPEVFGVRDSRAVLLLEEVPAASVEGCNAARAFCPTHAIELSWSNPVRSKLTRTQKSPFRMG